MKLTKKVLVITGYPPYRGMSVKGQWIENLLKNGYASKDGKEDCGYSKADGNPLGEKNPSGFKTII